MSQDIVRQIRKATLRKFSAEEKIRVVLEVEGMVRARRLCIS